MFQFRLRADSVSYGIIFVFISKLSKINNQIVEDNNRNQQFSFISRICEQRNSEIKATTKPLTLFEMK